MLYTAVLVSAGIAFWSLSPLRFQAEMGYQLLIILTMNMLGGLLLLPALIALLKPKFVLEKEDNEGAGNEKQKAHGFSAGTVSLPSKGGEKTTKATGFAGGIDKVMDGAAGDINDVAD